MALQMMHADHRHIPGITQRTGDRGANQERADQSRPGGIGNAVNGLRRGSCLGDGLVDHRQQPFDVVPRGQFGYHPAMLAVQLDLAENPVREQALVAVKHGNGGLVAGGLDAEHFHNAMFLIFRGQITTIPGPFPGLNPGSPGEPEV